jgi:coenzyme F420-reducing hydrogenase alpha subunit
VDVTAQVGGVNETAEQQAVAKLAEHLDRALELAREVESRFTDDIETATLVCHLVVVVEDFPLLVAERDRLAARVETLRRVAEAAQDYRDAQKKGWRKGFEEDEARDELDAALAALGSAVPGADE